MKSTGPQTKRDADSSVALPPKSYVEDFHHLSVAAPDRLDDASSVMAKARCTSVTVAEVGSGGQGSRLSHSVLRAQKLSCLWSRPW